jgi:hypothetical protein
MVTVTPDEFKPLAGCRSPDECGKANFCTDAWHCVSVANMKDHGFLELFDDLRKQRDEAVRLLEEEVLEFIEGQEDVADSDDGRPRPNRAMQIAQELRQFLATLDRTEKP